MLVDALVFGVYKCVTSLLNVSVLPLLELDFKRVYFIQTGRLDTRDECFETTSGRCCCYFQVPFLAVKWRVAQSKTKSLWMLCHLNQRLNVGRSCINQVLKNCVLLNAKVIMEIELLYLHRLSDILLMGGGLVNLTFHELRWHLLDLWDYWKRSIRVFSTIIDWGCVALLQGKGKIARFAVFCFIVFLSWPKCYAMLFSNTHWWVGSW